MAIYTRWGTPVKIVQQVEKQAVIVVDKTTWLAQRKVIMELKADNGLEEINQAIQESFTETIGGPFEFDSNFIRDDGDTIKFLYFKKIGDQIYGVFSYADDNGKQTQNTLGLSLAEAMKLKPA